MKLVGASGPPLRLTTDPASDTYPAWSPDGRQIAFRRTPRAADDADRRALSFPSPAGTVMVMPALGGPERKVADVPAARCPTLSWTPDGRWLATPAADSSGGSGIFLLPLEQGEARRLTSNPVDADICPALSSDGRALAYVSCTSDYRAPCQVLELQADFGPRGTPRRLVELRNDDSGRPGVGPGRRESRVLGGQSVSRPAGRGAGGREGPAGRADGALPGGVSRRSIASSSSAGSTTATSGSWRRAARPRPSSPPRASMRAPQFSPDGTRIAFQSSRWSDAGRSSSRARTDRAPFSSPTAWEGSRAALGGRPTAAGSPSTRSTQDGTFDVFVIDAAGGPPRRLTDGPVQ